MGFDAQLEENPRARIGDNGGPPLEDERPIDLEAALIVQRAAGLWAFLCETDAAKILAKRGAKLSLVIRRGLSASLKGVIPSGELARILGLNRSTVEDDIAFAEAWLDRNDELEADLGAMIEAVAKYVQIDPARLKSNMIEELEKDRLIKALERGERQAAKAAKQEAKTAEAKAAKAKGDELDDLEARLSASGVKNAKAIVARHRGPAAVAQRLTKSKTALSVLALLLAADGKTKHDERRLIAATLDGAALDLLCELELARCAEITPEDKAQQRVIITTFGASVVRAAASAKPPPGQALM